jgi:DNA-binding transcriptional ArsR family regulator
MEQRMKSAKRAIGPSEIDVRQAAELMRSLSNPNRLMIACALVEGEQSVSELEGKLGIKQPILSQQLADLREAGVVQARRSSKSVFYSVADVKAGYLIAALHQIFCNNGRFEVAPSKIPARTKPAVQAAVFAQVGHRFAKLMEN